MITICQPEATGYLPLESPGYINPEVQDLLLTDITAKDLRFIATELEVDYVGPAAFPGTFSVVGNIKGQNCRLMISLVCRNRTARDVPAHNIIFFI